MVLTSHKKSPNERNIKILIIKTRAESCGGKSKGTDVY